MNLKKSTLIISFVILLYLCFNSLCSVQASSNISVEDAGKAVASYLKSFYDQYASETVITSESKYRYTIYQAKRYESGVAKNGTQVLLILRKN